MDEIESKIETNVEEVSKNDVEEIATNDKTNNEQVLLKTKKESRFVTVFNRIAYAFIPFLIFLFFQQLAWSGNMLLSDGTGAKPAIWLDSQIPIISEFSWIYLLTFPIAIFTYFLVAYKDKKHHWNLWLTLVINSIISGIIYLCWQTQMVKEPFEAITLSDKLLLMIWGACKPVNCFPSQHVMMAMGILLGIHNQNKNIPLWLSCLLYIVSVLVMLSTVFLHQHYVLDVIASIVLMTLIYMIVKLCKFGDYMEKRGGLFKKRSKK